MDSLPQEVSWILESRLLKADYLQQAESGLVLTACNSLSIVSSEFLEHPTSHPKDLNLLIQSSSMA